MNAMSEIPPLIVFASQAATLCNYRGEDQNALYDRIRANSTIPGNNASFINSALDKYRIHATKLYVPPFLNLISSLSFFSEKFYNPLVLTGKMSQLMALPVGLSETVSAWRKGQKMRAMAFLCTYTLPGVLVLAELVSRVYSYSTNTQSTNHSC